MKKYAKRAALALCAGLISVALMPTLNADTWNKKTVLTVNEPVQLPTMVLQPGTYVLRLMDSQSDRHIVQVFDKTDQRLITTVLAIPNYRLRQTGKTEFQFWEVPAGQPKALRAWFYPGDLVGDEFAYPKNMSTQIAAYSKASVPTATYTESNEELAKSQVGAVDESGTAKDLDRETYTRTEPVAAAEPPKPQPVAETPQPQETPAPQTVAQNAPPQTQAHAELPHTGSTTPMITLIGILFLVAFVGTCRLAKS